MRTTNNSTTTAGTPGRNDTSDAPGTHGGSGAEPDVLEISNLTVSSKRDPDRELISDVSVSVPAGTCSVLVGESGSGKSLTAMTALRMENAHGGRLVDGQIRIDGHDMVSADREMLRHVRRRSVGLVLQDPGASLTPVMTIGRQMRGLLRLNGVAKRDIHREATALLGEVQLNDPDRIMRSYPHQLSGGMRQRVIIAMALVGDPKVLVADEPTTALDVSVQARIMDLFMELMAQRRLGILLITHDVALAAKYSDSASVMYAGQIVEAGPSRDVLSHPSHPYSKALMECLPQSHRRGSEIPAIPGRVPLGGLFPSGCRYHPRCAYVDEAVCPTHQQSLIVLNDDPARRVRCWKAHEVVAAAAAEPSGEVPR